MSRAVATLDERLSALGEAADLGRNRLPDGPVDTAEAAVRIAADMVDEGLIEAVHVDHAGFTPNGQMVSDEPTATDMFTGDFFAQGEQDGTAVFSDGVQLGETSEEIPAADTEDPAEGSAESSEQ